VEAHRVHYALTQRHNRQQFGHVWANCKQPPRCLWCGGGHLHKECPYKGNKFSTPTCCTCQWAEGEELHPANYRGCRHAKEEMQKKKSQRTPRTTTGRVLSSNLTTPGVSFEAALQEQPRTHRVTGADTMEHRVPEASPQHEQQKQVSQFGLQI
jgi:hypothetical protein